MGVERGTGLFDCSSSLLRKSKNGLVVTLEHDPGPLLQYE
jgi:hypothetical protein